MPKMQIVTDEMLNRADKIGQNTRNILEKQNMVTNLFKNMGKNFSGNIPSLMTQHMVAMDKEYQTMNGMLTNYKDFLEDSAHNYEWKEEELARMIESLSGTSTSSNNNATSSSSSDSTNTSSASSSSGYASNTSDSSSDAETTTAAPTVTGPVATSADNDKWGWNTENLPFSHNTPDMSSDAYHRSNGSVNVNTRELYNSWAKENRVNCVYYARARYLEVNGGDQYPFRIDQTIHDPEYIKNGNCVVRFDGHSVYVEHYDTANDVVWFSDSNMGSHPDGALQSMSFEDFKNFKGGFEYVEGIA
ncbi:MAG: hypothetical protein IJ597_00265 [Synergistaceae bacterium]|nr:hypothetical protein [Synergistaceae bacterium]